MAKSILIGLILLSALRTGLLAPRRFTRGQDLGEVKWEKNTSTASQFRTNTTKLHEGHSNVKNSVDSNEALESLLLNNVLGTQSAVKATKTVPLENKARIKTTAIGQTFHLSAASMMTSKLPLFSEISEDATTVQIDPTPAPSPVSKLPTRSSLYTKEAHKTEKKIRDVTLLHDVSGSPLTTGKPEANLPTPQETVYFFASQVGQVSTLQPIRTIHRLSDKSDSEEGLGLQRNKRKTRSVTQTPLLSSTLMPDEIAVKSTSVPTSSFSSVSLLDYQTITSTQNSIISQDPWADNDQKQEVSTAPSAIATEDMSDEPILVEVTQSKPTNPDNEYFTSTKEHLASESSSTNEFTAIPFVTKDTTQVETVDRTTEASAVETPSMTPLPEKKPSNGNSTTLDDLVPSETEPAFKNNTFMLNDMPAGLTELPISAITSGITSGYEVALTLARESIDKVITQASTPSLVTEHHTTDASVTHSSPAYLHQEVDENQEKVLTTTDSSIHPLEPSESTLMATEVTQAETVDYAWEVETTAFSSSTQLPEKIPTIPSNTLHSLMPTETEPLTQNVIDKQSEGQAHLTQLPPSTTTSAISSSDETIVTLAHESENEVTTAASTPPLATEDDTPDASTTPSSPSYLHQQVDENQEKGLTSTDSSIDQTESATESSPFVPNEIPADLTNLPISAIASGITSGYEVTLTLASESRDGIITQASTPSVATEDHTTDAAVTDFSPSHLHQEVDKNQDKCLTSNDSSIGPLDPTESTLISTEVTQAKAVDHVWEVETFSSSTQLPEKIPPVESNTLHSLMSTETESLIQNITDKQSEGQAHLTQLPTTTITSAISSSDETIGTLAHESENEVTTAASTPSLATGDDIPDASTTHSSPSYLDQEVDQNREKGLTSTDSSIHPLDPSESTSIATEVTQAKTVDYAWELETCLGSKAFSSSTQLPEKIPSVEKGRTHTGSSIYPPDISESPLATSQQSESPNHLVDFPASTIASVHSSDDEAKITLAQEFDHGVTTSASFSSVSTNDNIPDSLTTHFVSVPVGQTEATEATAATATELTTLSALSELTSSTSSSNRNLEQDGITFRSIPSTTEDIGSLPDALRLISDDPVVTTTMSPSSETISTDSSWIIIEKVAPTLNPETFIPTSIIPANPTTEATLLQTESETFPFARDLTFAESETQPGVSGNGVTEGIPLDSTANRESVTHSLDLELVLPTHETISDAVTEKPSGAPITSASLDVTSGAMETEPDDEAETTESDLSRSEQSSAKTMEFPDFSPESPPSLTITNDDTFSQASPSLPTFSDAIDFSTVEPSQGVSDSSEETSTYSLGTSTDPNEDTSEENELDPTTVMPVSEYATKPDLSNQAEETDDDTEATEEPQTMVLPTGGNMNFHKATGPLTNLFLTVRLKAPESPSPEEEDERSEQGEEEAKEDEDEKAEEGKEEEKEGERAEYGEEEERAEKGEEEEDEGAEKREEQKGGIEGEEEAEKGADNAEEEGVTEKGEEEEKGNADSVAGESPSSTEGETSHTSLEPNMSAGSYSTESGREPVENLDSSPELYTSSFGYSRTSTSKRPSHRDGYSSSPEEPSVSAGIENSDEDLRPSPPTYQHFREASSSTESQSDEYTRPTYSRYISKRPGIKNIPADVMSDRRADNTWARVSNLNEFASAETAVFDTTLASLLYASETPSQHATSSASSQEVHPSVSPTSLSSSPSIGLMPRAVSWVNPPDATLETVRRWLP